VPPLASWYVFTYATDTLYTYVCPVLGCTDSSATNFNPSAAIDDSSCLYGPAQCGGLSTVTFDGHTYALVGIGTQCWFAENLRSDTYLNGDPIPGNLSDAEWSSTTSGAQAVYGEGSSGVFSGSDNEAVNLAVYGRYYTWFAVNDARGLCPGGFHVPDDEDWNLLENALGGPAVAGLALKSSFPVWDGTNSYGFAGQPSGARNGLGGFGSQGSHGWLLSSSQPTPDARLRGLLSGSSSFDLWTGDLRNGYSVRCVQDLNSSYCHDTDYDGVCAENEVSGCTDEVAINFSLGATEDDGSCIYGPSAPAQCGGLSTVTFDGYTYDLVGIGTQCWFAENLRSDNYRNGDTIPGDLDDSQWASTTSGAQAIYGEGTSTVYAGAIDEYLNLAAFGRLYNWYSVDDSRGLCPYGFHVPSDDEWTLLENALGGSSVAVTALKASSPSWNGSNSSGFTALPGGLRDFNNGSFDYQGANGCWWSSTSSEVEAARYRHLGTGYPIVGISTAGSGYGFSVRCVRD
jgi:uncharacterized protein (TIGR02145 family)